MCIVTDGFGAFLSNSLTFLGNFEILICFLNERQIVTTHTFAQ